jgi:preprotein translocase subunit SecD
MDNDKPALRVVDGDRSCDARRERVAMSLVVHERKRLDIPVSALTKVEAFATETFCDGRGPVTLDLPHVRIWLTPNLQKRLRDFTCDIVGELTELHVGDKCISRPVVREPLGGEPSFQISVNDFAEAQVLADELRTGWRPMRAVQ